MAGADRPLLVARAVGRPAAARGADAAAICLRLHPPMAAGAGRSRDRAVRPGARRDGTGCRPRPDADPDPCREGRRSLFRRRRGDREGSRNRRAQRLDPALPGRRQGPDARQHRRRPASGTLSGEGGSARRDADLHAQLRRRPRPALRRRRAGRGRPGGFRRARHRQRLPRRAARTGQGLERSRRHGRPRHVGAGVRNGARRGRGRGAVRRGHRLLRHRGAAACRPCPQDPPARATGVPDHPVGRRGVEFRRPARRSQHPATAAEAGARRHRRLYEPRRRRLLPLRRAARPEAPGLVETGDPRRLLRLSAAQDGDDRRRRCRPAQRPGRRMGDGDAARPDEGHRHHRRILRPRAQPVFPGLSRPEGRFRRHQALSAHLGV